MRKVCGLNVYKDNVFVCIDKENGVKIQFNIGILNWNVDVFRNLQVSFCDASFSSEALRKKTKRSQRENPFGNLNFIFLKKGKAIYGFLLIISELGVWYV
jgi:hypothetical protein